MAENMNLIPANELPEAVGNEVEALCVENGQMKRKTCNLGGTYIIDLTKSADNSAQDNVFTINDINYDDFIEQIWNGRPFCLKGPLDEDTIVFLNPWSFYLSDGVLYIMTMSQYVTYSTYIFAFTNGTWTPPTE